MRAWISATTRGIVDPAEERPGSVVVSFADFTERRTFQQQLEHAAFHDALTGLPNRKLFMERLGHALELARRRGERVAVAFVDLDRPKRSARRTSWRVSGATSSAPSSRAAPTFLRRARSRHGCSPPCHRPSTSEESRADNAMYRVKSGGKNAVGLFA